MMLNDEPTIEVDTRKSKAVTFYSRRHMPTDRFCVIAVDPMTGAQFGHRLQCQSVACFTTLLEASRTIKLGE